MQKLTLRLKQLDETRPSLRQLAAAADVTVPTLRHYFGSREEVVEAVLTEHRRLGDIYIQRSSEPRGGLRESIRSYLGDLAWAMTNGPRVGDLFAVGFIEGLLNQRLGPVCLENLIDPVVDALVIRLQAHRERGELDATDLRHAALMLVSPLLVACQHQYTMFGCGTRPLDMERFLDDLTDAFVRAHVASPVSDRIQARAG